MFAPALKGLFPCSQSACGKVAWFLCWWFEQHSVDGRASLPCAASSLLRAGHSCSVCREGAELWRWPDDGLVQNQLHGVCDVPEIRLPSIQAVFSGWNPSAALPERGHPLGTHGWTVLWCCTGTCSVLLCEPEVSCFQAKPDHLAQNLVPDKQKRLFRENMSLAAVRVCTSCTSPMFTAVGLDILIYWSPSGPSTVFSALWTKPQNVGQCRRLPARALSIWP